jgi:hypothetical protein
MDDETLIVGYGPLSSFLTDKGFPISKSVLSKLGAPSVNAGPRAEGYWGPRPAFKPSVALAWARGRLRPARSTGAVSGSEPAAPIGVTTFRG